MQVCGTWGHEKSGNSFAVSDQRVKSSLCEERGDPGKLRESSWNHGWFGLEGTSKFTFMGRDTFHQTKAAASPVQHSRDGAASARQGKLLQRKGGKKDKAEQERRAATRDAVPSAGSGTNTAVQEQEPGGDVTVQGSWNYLHWKSSLKASSINPTGKPTTDPCQTYNSIQEDAVLIIKIFFYFKVN